MSLKNTIINYISKWNFRVANHENINAIITGTDWLNKDDIMDKIAKLSAEELLSFHISNDEVPSTIIDTKSIKFETLRIKPEVVSVEAVPNALGNYQVTCYIPDELALKGNFTLQDLLVIKKYIGDFSFEKKLDSILLSYIHQATIISSSQEIKSVFIGVAEDNEFTRDLCEKIGVDYEIVGTMLLLFSKVTTLFNSEGIFYQEVEISPAVALDIWDYSLDEKWYGLPWYEDINSNEDDYPTFSDERLSEGWIDLLDTNNKNIELPEGYDYEDAALLSVDTRLGYFPKNTDMQDTQLNLIWDNIEDEMAWLLDEAGIDPDSVKCISYKGKKLLVLPRYTEEELETIWIDLGCDYLNLTEEYITYAKQEKIPTNKQLTKLEESIKSYVKEIDRDMFYEDLIEELQHREYYEALTDDKCYLNNQAYAIFEQELKKPWWDLEETLNKIENLVKKEVPQNATSN